MELRLLYFEGCPGWEKTRDNFREISPEQEITLLDVNQQPKLPDSFYGSPTINFRENEQEPWKDLFGKNGDSVMACRTYNFKGAVIPYIPREMLEQQLEAIAK